MYVPFARKYRPKFFKDLVGQEHVKKVLLNAVKLNKVASAYIFAGPRGTGKTTVARILTRALNCLNPQPDGEPCGECENCLAIDRGNFPDLIEIDAASSRGIDDIRAIRDAVSYTPIKGKYKVYILDEAHMLTKEAFNALLKTLEEPPPKTLFILCTTEYEKIIPTILSRCQRLIFSKLKEEEIVQRLKEICQREGLECEEKALYIIAKLSDGGMRDAISLLDQVSTYGEGKVNEKVVEEFLGILSQERVREFLKLLLDSKVDEAIRFLRDIKDKGYNLVRFWDALEEEVRDLILVKSLKEPERYVKIDDFHKSLKDIPLNALLYLEKVINTARIDAKSRDFLRACELALIKTLIVKDILPVRELLKVIPVEETKQETQKVENVEEQGKEKLDTEKAEEQKESVRDRIIEEVKKSLGLIDAERLRTFEYREEGSKVIFFVPEKELKSFDINKIKLKFPEVEFEVIKSKEEGEELPPFVKKAKDLFGAKIIRHEKGDKSKGSSG